MGGDIMVYKSPALLRARSALSATSALVLGMGLDAGADQPGRPSAARRQCRSLRSTSATGQWCLQQLIASVRLCRC